MTFNDNKKFVHTQNQSVFSYSVLKSLNYYGFCNKEADKNKKKKTKGQLTFVHPLTEPHKVMQFYAVDLALQNCSVLK